MQTIERLFSEGLQLLYGAHQQGAKQAAANYDTSTSPKLRRMLRAGSKANLQQGKRLESVFRAADLPVRGKHDPAMQGIIEANEALVRQTWDPVRRDLANIASGQVAAHFYLATYGTLRHYAEVLGYQAAATLLQKTLNETGSIDREFSRLAARLTSRAGRSDYANESALHTTAAMHPVGATAALVGLVAAGTAFLATRSGRRDPG